MRRQALKFRNSSPGIKCVRAFEQRHKKRVTIRHPTDDATKNRGNELQLSERDLKKAKKRDVLRHSSIKWKSERTHRRAELANMSANDSSRLVVTTDQKRARQKLRVREESDLGCPSSL